MNREHLALLGCCAHVLKHAHLRREYKRTTTNFLAYVKTAGQRGSSDNPRTRQEKPRQSAKDGAVTPDNHNQLTDSSTVHSMCVSAHAGGCYIKAWACRAFPPSLWSQHLNRHLKPFCLLSGPISEATSTKVHTGWESKTGLTL